MGIDRGPGGGRAGQEQPRPAASEPARKRRREEWAANGSAWQAAAFSAIRRGQPQFRPTMLRTVPEIGTVPSLFLSGPSVAAMAVPAGSLVAISRMIASRTISRRRLRRRIAVVMVPMPVVPRRVDRLEFGQGQVALVTLVG